MEKIIIRGYLPSGDNRDGAIAPHDIWLDNSYISSNFDEIKHKAVVTGHYLETYEFQTSITRKKINKGIRTFNPDNVRKGNVRAISTIKSIITGNFYSKNTKFVVLTFNNENKFNTENLKVCNVRKQIFVKKMQKIYGDFKYLIIPEYQKRGVVHYHLICSLPYVNKEELEKLWGHGFCKIQYVKNRFTISTYLTKQVKKLLYYLSKNIKDVTYKGYRRYYCSNSVAKPEKFYNKDADKLVSFCLNRKHEFVEQREYHIEFIGYVTYRAYYIKKKVTLRDMDWAAYGYDNKDEVF